MLDSFNKKRIINLSTKKLNETENDMNTFINLVNGKVSISTSRDINAQATTFGEIWDNVDEDEVNLTAPCLQVENVAYSFDDNDAIIDDGGQHYYLDAVDTTDNVGVRTKVYFEILSDWDGLDDAHACDWDKPSL